MDIEQAKFILSSFRPDGQDAQDQDFTDALALATEDRELAVWLAEERAHDALFSKAINSIEIPAELKEEILSTLNPDSSFEPDPEIDDLFTDAFASIQPPEDLREQILTSMELEQKVIRPTFFNSGWRKLVPAAAAILILAVSTIMLTRPNDDAHGITSYDLQQETGSLLVNDGISLIGNSTEESINWLQKQDLPTVDLPESLKAMRCAGASAITLKNGTKASLMRFFDQDGNEINMLVIASENVADYKQVPSEQNAAREEAYYCGGCDYMIAKIRSGDAVVMILSQLDKDSTVDLF